ncbi:DNA polymerase I, partial [candidate division WWE3 bacterium]|nr:DNA polymerase I [candidate division WWE3 bacterium]
QAEEKKIETVIVSNDKDVLQLLSDKTKIFIPDNSKEGGKYFGVVQFKEKYGFEPVNMIDYKALRGDSSDNVPGVYGIGDKTALSLIRKYKTIERLYEDINNIAPESLKLKLLRGYESALLCKKIVKIDCSSFVRLDLSASKQKLVDRLRVVEVLKKYNFKSLIRRLGFEIEGESAKVKEADDKQFVLFK